MGQSSDRSEPVVDTSEQFADRFEIVAAIFNTVAGNCRQHVCQWQYRICLRKLSPRVGDSTGSIGSVAHPLEIAGDTSEVSTTPLEVSATSSKVSAKRLIMSVKFLEMSGLSATASLVSPTPTAVSATASLVSATPSEVPPIVLLVSVTPPEVPATRFASVTTSIGSSADTPDIVNTAADISGGVSGNSNAVANTSRRRRRHFPGFLRYKRRYPRHFRGCCQHIRLCWRYFLHLYKYLQRDPVFRRHFHGRFDMRNLWKCRLNSRYCRRHPPPLPPVSPTSELSPRV